MARLRLHLRRSSFRMLVRMLHTCGSHIGEKVGCGGCRPERTVLISFLIAVKLCLLIITAWHFGLTTILKKGMKDFEVCSTSHITAYFLLYIVTAGILMLSDILTVIIACYHKYEFIKWFIIMSTCAQLIVVLPFSASGIYFTTQLRSFPQLSLDIKWFHDFTLLEEKSLLLIEPPNQTFNFAVETQEKRSGSVFTNGNDSAVMKDLSVNQFGVRKLPRNLKFIAELDGTMNRISETQTELLCCGYDAPEDWYKKYTANFSIPHRSQYYIWWAEADMISSYPLSCYAAAKAKLGIRSTVKELLRNRSSLPEQLEGCKIVAHKLIYNGIMVLACTGVAAVLVQMLLAPLLYYFIERKRRIERHRYLLKWKRDLEASLCREKAALKVNPAA